MSNHFKKHIDDVDEDICLDKIARMKHKLSEKMCCELCEGDISAVDTHEAGEVIDMIKDLAAAERYCAQACYYETVTEAMREGEDYPYGRMGYTPDPDDPDWDERDWDDMERKDSNKIRRMMRRDGRRVRDDERMDPRYGKSFNEYRTMRRHYTKTHDEADKDRMKSYASEHVMDSITTLREIWENAEPDLRQRMKADLTKLVSEMA